MKCARWQTRLQKLLCLNAASGATGKVNGELCFVCALVAPTGTDMLLRASIRLYLTDRCKSKSDLKIGMFTTQNIHFAGR